MTQERFTNQYCQLISVDLNPSNGILEFCELEIIREGKPFVIRTATPSYILRLKKHNLTLPEELQLDDNIYPLEEGFTNEDVCELLSKIPFDQLKPYLTEPLQPKNSP